MILLVVSPVTGGGGGLSNYDHFRGDDGLVHVLIYSENETKLMMVMVMTTVFGVK